MTDLLASRHLRWLLVLLILLATGQLLFRTEVQTDITAFMPRAQDKAQSLLLQQLEQGSAARLWMLALTRESSEILADISRKLAAKASASPLVSQVLNGQAVLDGETGDKLYEYRYLLSDRMLADSYSQQGLQSTFEELLQTLRSPMSTFSKKLAGSDPGGEALHLLASYEKGVGKPELQQGVWFNKDRDQALLLIESSASATDLDAQKMLRQQLLLWLDELKQEQGSPSVQMKMGGVPVIGLETRQRIREASQRLSVLATIFMVLFMSVVYRHPLKVVLTVLPLVSGVLVGAATVSWWFGSIHGVTLAFGITLLGVAVDYPVHLLSHQRTQERLAQTARRIWPVLTLGVLSTVLGFSAMLWTDFPGLAQLGLFSIAGLLTAAGMTIWVLPAMAAPLTVSSTGFVSPGRIAAQPVDARLKLILVAAVMIAAAWAVQDKELWSRDIQALSPVPLEVKEEDRAMRQIMGAADPGFVMLLTARSIQQLLEKQEQLQPLLVEAIDRGYIQAADYAAKILPSKHLQVQRRSWIPSQQLLISNLDNALQNLPFKPESFAGFIQALEHTSQLPPMLPEMLDNTVLGMRLDSLLLHHDQGVAGLIQLVGVKNGGDLASLLGVSSREDLWLLNLPQAAGALVDQFRQAVLEKIFLALVLIGLLVAIWLRKPGRWLRVMLPVLLSVITAMAVVLATGTSLNLFHLVSLLLVAGIGLDYALFFSRPCTDADDWQRTMHALTVCCISTVVVFSLLAISDIPVLQAIGLTVVSGTLAAYALSWLLSTGAAAHSSC